MTGQPVHLIWLVLAVLGALGFVLCVNMIDGVRGGGDRRRSARWARRRDLSTLRIRRAESSRITLGRHGRGLLAAEARASVMVVGPTQSGKTTGLVIPALREWAGPVVATSVKTDLL